MLSFLRSTWLLFRLHLVMVGRSRRTLISLALATLPPLLSWLAVQEQQEVRSDEIACAFSFFFTIQVIVPLLALIQGSAVVNEEIESRTITFPLTRPISRGALFLGRWLATVVILSGSLGVSAYLQTVTAGDVEGQVDRRSIVREPEGLGRKRQRHYDNGGDWREWRTIARELRAQAQEEATLVAAEIEAERPDLFAAAQRRILLACILGGAIYSLVFAVIGVFLKHPMIVGLGYAFAVEGALANLPGKTQSLSILYWLRGIVADEDLPVWGQIYQYPLKNLPGSGEAVWTLAVVGGIALALGLWRIARKQFVLSS